VFFLLSRRSLVPLFFFWAFQLLVPFLIGQVKVVSSGSDLTTLEYRLQEMSSRYQRIFSSQPNPDLDLKLPTETPAVNGRDRALGSTPTERPAFMRPPEPEDRDLDRGSRVVAQGSLEDNRGTYYLHPFLSVAMSSPVSFAAPPKPPFSFEGSEVEPEVGYYVGFSLGRRWNNLSGELHLDYGQMDYSYIKHPKLSIPAIGESKIFILGSRIGYGLPLGQDGWIRFAAGAGWGNREDSVHSTLILDPPDPPTNKAVFVYDFLVGLGYAFTDSFSGHLGYRYLGTTENGNFGPLRSHLVELAFGADF